MKILIVDDDVVARTKLAELCAPYGECTKAVDGQEGLKFFEDAHKESVPFDLITMDVEMPGISGQEAVKRIRDIEQLLGIQTAKQVKILMVTSRRELKHVSSAYNQGCDEYLNKPATVEDVKDKLKKIGLLR